MISEDKNKILTSKPEEKLEILFDDISRKNKKIFIFSIVLLVIMITVAGAGLYRGFQEVNQKYSALNMQIASEVVKLKELNERADKLASQVVDDEADEKIHSKFVYDNLGPIVNDQAKRIEAIEKKINSRSQNGTPK
ncbi:hypothetical protein [Solimicrobium silvestre]|uniref:Uncharacterized protein n=1 Tax=Solimicrobium silvestre TaxID=2099400 RepID=A0A2S9GTC4_9BURK|nr:hypothetical protein [Solimicrobium silvestre]PRC90969.1 hypothetical protein S2091_4265 [Solimicrobium silvestre]